MKTKLNLGCGRDIRPDWINVDITPLEGVDIVGDISAPATFASIPDDTITVIDMSHILEHIVDPLPMMQALHRIAVPDCRLFITVPHGACDMAFADPQHVRQYFPASFQFFAQPAYRRADYNYRGDWAVEVIDLLCDPNLPDTISDEQLGQLINTARNIVWGMRARLRAIKPARDVKTTWTYNPTIQVRKA